MINLDTPIFGPIEELCKKIVEQGDLLPSSEYLFVTADGPDSLRIEAFGLKNSHDKKAQLAVLGIPGEQS